LVLTRACWEFETSAFEGILGISDAAFFREVQVFFKKLEVPQYFFVQHTSEKPQYFDWANPLSMKQLQLILKQKPNTLLLTEMLPAPDQCVVDQAGKRAAEFVLEFEV